VGQSNDMLNLQLGQVHVPTLLAAVIVILGVLAVIGLFFKLVKKI
jgi:hypothetical protein